MSKKGMSFCWEQASISLLVLPLLSLVAAQRLQRVPGVGAGVVMDVRMRSAGQQQNQRDDKAHDFKWVIVGLNCAHSITSFSNLQFWPNNLWMIDHFFGEFRARLPNLGEALTYIK